MALDVSSIERYFQPKDAEAITGVSVMLQRDWRRRGLLTEQKSDGWARFGLSELIELCVMKACSDSGISVQMAREFSHRAILPTKHALNSFPGLIVVSSNDVRLNAAQKRFLSEFAGSENERYLVVSYNSESDQCEVMNCAQLDEVDSWLQKTSAVHCIVVDCERIAKRIAERAQTPLMAASVSKIEDSK